MNYTLSGKQKFLSFTSNSVNLPPQILYEFKTLFNNVIFIVCFCSLTALARKIRHRKIVLHIIFVIFQVTHPSI